MEIGHSKDSSPFGDEIFIECDPKSLWLFES